MTVRSPIDGARFAPLVGPHAPHQRRVLCRMRRFAARHCRRVTGAPANPHKHITVAVTQPAAAWLVHDQVSPTRASPPHAATAVNAHAVDHTAVLIRTDVHDRLAETGRFGVLDTG